MEAITGLTGFDWALAQLYAISLALVVGSFLWRIAGTRLLGVLVVPFAVGAAGCVVLAVLFRPETSYLVSRIGDRTATVGVAAVVVLLGAAVADFLVVRVSRLVAPCIPRRTHAADISMGMVLVLSAAIGLVGLGTAR